MLQTSNSKTEPCLKIGEQWYESIAKSPHVLTIGVRVNTLQEPSKSTSDRGPIPAKFLALARDKRDWLDVVALLPVNSEKSVLEPHPITPDESNVQPGPVSGVSRMQHPRLALPINQLAQTVVLPSSGSVHFKSN
jgi:hypothetical protein